MMARKRKQLDLDSPVYYRSEKRLKLIRDSSKCRDTNTHNGSLSRTLLPLYYTRVVSLRQFLLSKLPTSSKFRRKRLLSYGVDPQTTQKSPHLLDSTVVGVHKETGSAVEEERRRDFLAFTQSQQKLSQGSNSNPQLCRNEEVRESLAKIKL